MSAKRAAIRGGLAIRRATHRPPWSARKSRGHRFIVARPPGASGGTPLKAASLATALAILGAGVALVRTERERRTAKRKRRARSASLLGGEPAATGLQRVLVGQLDLAIELLERYPGKSSERTVHETRKALKRARAIVRLLRGQLGGKRFARENAALRDCARRLAGARDAVVLLDTLDGLLARKPELSDPSSGKDTEGVCALHAELQAERASVTTTGEPRRAEIERHRAVALELATIRKRIAAWELSDRGKVSAKLPAGGMERVYRQGRRRMRRARRARRHRREAAAMHMWRKSVKDLRYVAETLDRSDAQTQQQSKRARRLKRTARRADRLGEMLGEEHDLALLAEVVRRHAKRFRGPGRGHRSLLKAIERRRRRLHKRALRKGKRLYERKPKRFVRGLRGAL
jgi:hypothetical protein